jgi:alpha-tubulin suppressor-like RCC1 family protein
MFTFLKKRKSSHFFARALALSGQAVSAISFGVLALSISACTLSARRQSSLSTITSTAITSVPGTGSFSVSGPSSVQLNACSSAYTLTALDSLGNAAIQSSSLSVTLVAGGSGTGALFADSGCTIPLTTTTIASGTSSETFYFKDTSSEILFLTASASGMNSAGAIVKITALPASQLVLSGPESFSVGSCSLVFVINAEDAFGDTSPVSSVTTVHLSAGGSAIFYTDSGCTSPTGSLSLAAGSSSVSFYVKDTVIESLLATATATGLTTGNISLTSLGGAPSKLVFSGPVAPTTGACSTAYAVTSEDAHGNPSVVSTSTSVALAGKGLGTFYSNPTCATSLTTVTLGVGANSANFYFKDNTVESDLFTATATGLTAATYPITTQAGAATKLLVSGPLAIAQSGCAGPYTVVSEDTNSNASNVSPAVQVNLTSSGASVFHALSNCSDSAQSSVTIGLGTSSKTFYVLDGTAQTMTVTGTDNAGLLTASTTANIVVSATALVITGPSNPITAATCTGPYTVTNTNGAGSATTVGAATPITLTKTGSTAAFYATSACSPAVTTVSIAMSSSSQTFYIKDATSENVTLTATATAIASGTLAVIVGTPAPTKLVVTGPSAPTAGACSGPYTVTSQNVNSTVSPVTALTAVALAGSGSGTFYSDACVTTATTINIAASSSSQTFYLKDTLKESLTLQASATGLTQGTENISVAASTATQLVLAGPQEVPQSTCSAAFSVTSLDTYRNTSNVGSSLTINLSGQGAGTFYSDNTCATPVSSVTLASGTNSISFYFLDTTNESNTFTATDGTSSLGSASKNITVAPPPILVSGGSSNTCAVVNGAAYCWGNNSSGALGNGSSSPASSIPAAVQDLSQGVTAISVGNMNACAIANGAVWCWGNNSSGQLGNGSTNQSLTPVQVQGLSGGTTTVSTSATGSHSCAVVNGAAFCWGLNSFGQLGNNSAQNTSAPVQVNGLTAGVSAIATGYQHTCAVVSGGAWCWGSNSNGQIGDGTTNTRYIPTQVTGLASGVVGVVTGQSQSCALLNTGSIQCWGINQFGQLGNGTTTQSLNPVSVTGIANATSLSSTYEHSCAIVGGGVQCWGNGGYGQLGNNSLSSSSIPVTPNGLSANVTAIGVGNISSCAVVSGALQCWGSNQFGQLGNGELISSANPATVAGLTSGVTAISLGYDHACATVSGGVQCWGDNYYGEVGISGTSPFQMYPTVPQQTIAAASGATAIAGGAYFGCAVVSGGVQCWGQNTNGQLGTNSTTSTTSPVQVQGLAASSGVTQIVTGQSHSCALVNGGIQCWGINSVGQLGDGTTNTRYVPVAVSGLNSGVTSITAGYQHTCALSNSGALYCWGSNTYGQLGNNSTTNSLSPVQVQSLASTATAIVAYGNSTCAILSSGAVQCWGYNGDGELGNNSTLNSSVPMQVQGLTSATALGGTSTSMCAVVNGGVQCWGSNLYSQLGSTSYTQSLTPLQVPSLPSGSGVTALSSGATNFTICAVVGGAAECWGSNRYRQLGLGTPWWSLAPENTDPF